MNRFIDEAKIRQAVEALIVPDGVFEVRIIKKQRQTSLVGNVQNC